MISMTVFATIGVIGLIVLVISSFLDDIFDFFGGEPVIPSIAAFATFFGFVGALGYSVAGDDNPGLYTVIAGVAGLLAGGVFYIIFRKFKAIADADDSFVPNLNDLVGKTARVDWWTGDRGSVVATWLGQPRSFKADTLDDATYKSGDVLFISEVIDSSHLVVSKARPVVEA
ncbi:hypothetical protein [Aeromicrobium sp. 179-A 4D2 NHS]|uniref:hypothetical protein n=1 Tax=Aeromicrobium sp. 179-A 4D2 NHS TaxID=3142375 RepID=UPI0039A1BB02